MEPHIYFLQDSMYLLFTLKALRELEMNFSSNGLQRRMVINSLEGLLITKIQFLIFLTKIGDIITWAPKFSTTKVSIVTKYAMILPNKTQHAPIPSNHTTLMIMKLTLEFNGWIKQKHASLSQTNLLKINQTYYQLKVMMKN